jgi:hypothetical protein
MILLRLVMIVTGASLVAGGLGLTMIGVFAFIGMPMLILGLGLAPAPVLAPEDCAQARRVPPWVCHQVWPQRAH